MQNIKRKIASWVLTESGFELHEERISLLPEKADASFCTGTNANSEIIAHVLNEKKNRFPVIDCIRCVKCDGLWILITFGDGFYNEILHAYTKPVEKDSTYDSYLLQRMKMLSRYPSCGCPDNPKIRKAIYLALIASETGKRREEAERALLEMGNGVAPEDRQQLLRTCGDVARAAINLLTED